MKKAFPKKSLSKKPTGKSAAPKAQSSTRSSAPKAVKRREVPVTKKRGKPQKSKTPPVPIRREPTAEEKLHQQHVAQFEKALKLFNSGDFAKSREVFQTLAGKAVQELAQRARVYLNVCNQRLSRPVIRLKTADDYYNYAVSMANQGNQEEAEINLNKALKLAPKSDYILYALATTQALRENSEGAMESLQRAIELNERNRYLAQNDPDFASLEEDPRFTELIYPERPVS